MTSDCPYCAKPMCGTHPTHNRFPTRDHVVPECKGGSIIVIVCLRCNNDKGDIPLQGWLGRLRLRGDPRAEHVARFIEQNPSLVPPILQPLPLKMTANDNALKCEGIFMNQDLDFLKKRRWLCRDCDRGFKTAIGAAEHWNTVHPRKAS